MTEELLTQIKVTYYIIESQYISLLSNDFREHCRSILL